METLLTERKASVADERRFLRVAINPTMLAMLRPGTTCIETSIPVDAQVRMVSYDPASDQFWIMIQHHTFAQIPEGEQIPIVSGPAFADRPFHNSHSDIACDMDAAKCP